MSTFKGHGVLAMIANVLLAIWPLLALFSYKFFLAISNPIVATIALLYFSAIFPHPTYLFFEIKHLLFKDGIADDLDLEAIVVFGGLSLLGLGIQVATNVLVIQLLPAQLSRPYMALALSFLASLGACLGLTDLVWLHILWPPKVLEHISIFIKNKGLVPLCLGTTVLLAFLTMIFI